MCGLFCLLFKIFVMLNGRDIKFEEVEDILLWFFLVLVLVCVVLVFFGFFLLNFDMKVVRFFI